MNSRVKRNRTIDIVRGFSIILIMFYHLVYRPRDGFVDRAIRELGWCIVPFFYIIPGYFYKPGRFGIGEELKRHIRSVLIPAVKMTLLLIALLGIWCMLFHSYTLTDVIRDGIYAFLRPELASKLIPQLGDAGIVFSNTSVVWFIWTMMWTMPVFLVLAKLTVPDVKKTLICCIILLAVGIPLYVFVAPLPWSLNHVPVYAAIMLFGSLLSSFDLLERISSMKMVPSLITSVIAAVIHFLLFSRCGTDHMYEGALGTAGFTDVPVYFLETFIGSYVFYNLGRVIDRFEKTAVFLSYVGRNSLIILLLHFPFGVVFSDLLKTYIRPGPYWYLDLVGIELTSVIIYKSIVVFLLSSICSILTVVLVDRIRKNKQEKFIQKV